MAAALALAPAAEANGINGNVNVFTFTANNSAKLGRTIVIGGHHWGPDGEFITGSCGPINVTLNSLKKGGSVTNIGKAKLHSDIDGETRFSLRWKVNGPPGEVDFGKWRIVATQKCSDPDDDPYTMTASVIFRIKQ
jgi:hypothetical protein